MKNLIYIIILLFPLVGVSAEQVQVEGVWSEEQAGATIVGRHQDLLGLGNSAAFRKTVVDEWKREHVPGPDLVPNLVKQVEFYGKSLNVDHWLLKEDMFKKFQELETKEGTKEAVKHLLLFAGFLSYKDELKEDQTADFSSYQSELEGYQRVISVRFESNERFKKKLFEEKYIAMDSPRVLNRFLRNGGFMHMAEFLALFAEGYYAIPIPEIERGIHKVQVHQGAFWGAEGVFSHDYQHLRALCDLLYNEGQPLDMKLMGDKIWKDIDDSKTAAEQHFKIFVYYYLIHDSMLTGPPQVFSDAFNVSRYYGFKSVGYDDDHYPYRQYFIKHGFPFKKEGESWVHGLYKECLHKGRHILSVGEEHDPWYTSHLESQEYLSKIEK